MQGVTQEFFLHDHGYIGTQGALKAGTGSIINDAKQTSAIGQL